MKLITKLLINAIAFYVVASVVPGVSISNYQALFLVALIWGIISVLVKPILSILTFPITIVTLGLFSFIINAGLLMLTDRLVDGFFISNFSSALLASIVLSLVNLGFKILNRD